MLCMIRLLSTKCISYPFNLSSLIAGHQHYIKAAKLVAMLLQIMLRSQSQFLLLLGRDATGSPTKCGVGAHAYLHEHQRFAILHHQINLAKTAMIVLRNELKAFRLQKSCSGVFCIKTGIIFVQLHGIA